MGHEHGGGEKAMREIAEACEQEEIETANRRIRAFRKSDAYLAYLARMIEAAQQTEPVVSVSPHPFTTMSDFELKQLGNDVY